MAVVTTDKALNLASRLTAASTKLLEAAEAMANISAEKTAAGISFTDAAFLAALPNSTLKHVDGAILDGIISTVPTINSFVSTSGVNMQKARP